MQDIGQNWVWILIAVAVLAFFFLRRGRRGHGDVGHGDHGHGSSDGMDHGGFGAVGHGSHGDRDNAREMSDSRPDPWAQPPEAAIDPVSGSAVSTASAITSVHQGKAHYFGSKENRDRFEAAPQEYASKAQGVPIDWRDGASRPHRRHRGC